MSLKLPLFFSVKVIIIIIIDGPGHLSARPDQESRTKRADGPDLLILALYNISEVFATSFSAP